MTRTNSATRFTRVKVDSGQAVGPDWRFRRVLWIAAILSLGSVVAACGAAAPTVKVRTAPLAHLVPKVYRGKTLVVGVAPYPPMDIANANGTVTGEEPELLDRVGQLLGLKFKFAVTTLSGTIPGIESGRFQVATIVGDFIQRQATVNFDDTVEGGSSLLERLDESYKPTDVLGLCGHTIGIEAASAEIQVTNTISGLCAAKGLSKITVATYPNVSSADLALQSRRVEGVLTNSAGNSYAARESHGLYRNQQLAGGTGIKGWGNPLGWATPKGSGLAQAFAAALQQLVRTGVYGKIFAQWGISANELKPSQIGFDKSKAVLPPPAA